MKAYYYGIWIEHESGGGWFKDVHGAVFYTDSFGVAQAQLLSIHSIVSDRITDKSVQASVQMIGDDGKPKTGTA